MGVCQRLRAERWWWLGDVDDEPVQPRRQQTICQINNAQFSVMMSAAQCDNIVPKYGNFRLVDRLRENLPRFRCPVLTPPP